MSKRIAIKPSDVVTWKVSPDGARWTLRKLNPSVPFLDKTDARYGLTVTESRRWFAVIKCTAPVDYQATIEHDENARVWQLATQGDAPGGRRYRDHLTLTEAQRVALAWLDRRFA